MKVVLFCGGLGTRLREHSDTIPKPLAGVGPRPIIWHLMRYYAHFGHTEFVLCLGYRGDMIREYFLSYYACMTNDFTMTLGGKGIELYGRDASNWKITFVDTGLHSNIGQRLSMARRFLGDDEMFLANYSDGLSDLRLDEHTTKFAASKCIASFAAVKTLQSFHAVELDDRGLVKQMGPISNQAIWVNGGYFILRKEIFSYIKDGEELVEQPFGRLIPEGKLMAQKHAGFWQCMDTFKDKIAFDRMEARGDCPWMVWK
jgi:glucose-1-phosphate cytidylyltransferase